MTFKHTKFEDSVTMRSLEKLAQSKGLVKDDSLLQKIASLKSKKAADLTPTDNLTENLLKLCSGLRASGLEKYAEELESNFVMYKKAESLYETSKEEGEDLVDAAHPKGSHKLEGVEGDSVIETIIDQQLQDLKMVDKKPSGKLTNAIEIIEATKIALGQDFLKDWKPAPETDKSTEDKSKEEAVKRMQFEDKPWSDGNRANSKYINQVIIPAAVPLAKIIPLIDKLITIASDERVPKNIGQSIAGDKQQILSYTQTLLGACKSAAEKARALETDRLSRVPDDISQSRVSFSEVASFFNNRALGTKVGGAKDFAGLVAAISTVRKDLGSEIYSGWSTGFDFDEDFMQGVKSSAMGILQQIRSVLAG